MKNAEDENSIYFGHFFHSNEDVFPEIFFSRYSLMNSHEALRTMGWP